MEWILCDERLPEEGQMVLTTIRGHDVIIPQEGETIKEAMERIWNEVCYVSVGFIGSDGWYGADGYPLIVHPIAWMPLPKPYRKTENSSEKPNNSTISKMEQVDKDINVRSKTEPQTEADWKDEMWTEAIVTEPTTEDCSTVPTSSILEQVDEPQTCSVNGRPYSECSSCEYFKCTADEPYEYEIKALHKDYIEPYVVIEDEPQTDCSWK